MASLPLASSIAHMQNACVPYGSARGKSNTAEEKGRGEYLPADGRSLRRRPTARQAALDRRLFAWHRGGIRDHALQNTYVLVKPLFSLGC